MSTSAIFSAAPSLITTEATSAIFSCSPQAISTNTTSAIFSTGENSTLSMLTILGPPSSAPYVEDYASATTPLGPINQDTYVNFIQSQFFGPSSSDQYQIVAGRVLGLRGPQFSTTTIALDRFSTPLAALLAIYQDIDLTTTATTTIYTVPNASRAIILGCLVRIKTSDSPSSDAQVSLGINPSTTDIFPVETIVDVQDVGDYWSFWKDTSSGVVAPASSNIDIDVSVAATATTLDCDIYLIGLLI